LAFARREWIDATTGLPVKHGTPGAVASGRWVTRLRPAKGKPLVNVEIDREELGPPELQTVDLPRVELVERAQAEHEQQTRIDAPDVRAGKRKGKQKIRGVGETFRTAGKAAREYLDANHSFFDVAEEMDLGDQIRDWMDGIEVKRGPGWRRLNKTKKGAEILALFVGMRGGEAFRALFTWIFSRARDKRWTSVDWGMVDRLEEAIRSTPGAPELPPIEHRPAAAVEAAALALEHMTPKAAEEAARVHNQEQLAELAAELAEAYKAVRKCVGPEARKAIRTRAKLVADLAEHPARLWRLRLCIPEGTTRLCGLPVLVTELERVRKACEEGYEINWPIVEAAEAQKAGRHEEAEQFAEGVQAMAERKSNPKGVPDLRDLGTTMEMGKVRSVIVENPNGDQVEYKWKRPHPLLMWSPKQRALVWVEGVNPSPLKKGAPRDDGAARLFEKFAEGQPAEQHRTLVPPAKKMRRVGRAIRINYTEPYGRAPAGTIHYHDFSPSDAFYQAGRSTPFAFAVTGPRLTVTERGIVY
jgi:hypothetical protein